MKKFLALFFCFLLISLSLILAQNTKAASFTSSYLRLNNLSANSALSGTVCAQASAVNAGVENKISVTFPSDFTTSQTASNWTTDTANLPAGATAWPGIGSTATSISGKTATFASSDLTTTNLYCFNFTASSSTTGSSGNDKTGTIATKNSSDTTIDSGNYAISIVTSNQINITAKVDPQISDLPITISSLTSVTQFAQNSTISYRITYGNSAATSVPLTIQASWSQGTVQGSPIPSVDILDYVIGSAANAYGNTAPVIDTVNRTITWTINSIPGATTNKTVDFSLKTNSNYTGGSIVNFTVSANSTSGTTTTTNATVSQSYLYQSTAAITPTPTPGTSLNSPTPTPTSTISPLSFSEVSVRSISSNDAKIYILTNNNSLLNLLYGESPTNLSKTIKTLTYEKENIITLPELDSDTNYYFKAVAKDENGNSKTSDIFIFRTASVSETPTVNTQSLVVTSNSVVLLNPQNPTAVSQNQFKNIVLIPQDTVFEINFSLNKLTRIKSIQAIIQNKNVLGINTFSSPQDASSNFVNLVETRTGVYTGRILSSQDPGNYEIYIKIIDYSGNITLQKIADIKIVHKLKVLEKGTKKPIENARVLFYLYNPTTKIFELISPQILPINNPSYSEIDGAVDIVLPKGKYRMETSAIGYDSQNTDFEISFSTGDFPTIYLTKQPFSIINVINYYLNALGDVINASQNYVKLHADSNRLFDLTSFGTIFIFLAISALSISARTHIGIFYFPYFLIFKLMILFNKNTNRIIFGKVMEDETNIPLSKASVYLLTPDSTQIIATLKTNKLGEFYYNNPLSQNFKIKIQKEGFEDPVVWDFINSRVEEIPVIFKLKNKEKLKRSMLQIIFIYLEDFLGMGMESIILIGLLLQIYFVFVFGLLRVLPFLIITLFNLILIFTYLYKPKALQP